MPNGKNGDERPMAWRYAGEAGASTVDSDAVLAVARAHGASAAQVRLAWSLQQGPHVLAIPGTSDPEHLVENVAAGAIRLSDDEREHLRSHHQDPR